ncbi:MAG: hypothetical protein GXP49_01880, partial [Deltaproteobacteria bacterium]|nr:hypothetical protein [Deltaproteobacteria bacterium]
LLSPSFRADVNFRIIGPERMLVTVRNIQGSSMVDLVVGGLPIGWSEAITSGAASVDVCLSNQQGDVLSGRTPVSTDASGRLMLNGLEQGVTYLIELSGVAQEESWETVPGDGYEQAGETWIEHETEMAFEQDAGLEAEPDAVSDSYDLYEPYDGPQEIADSQYLEFEDKGLEADAAELQEDARTDTEDITDGVDAMDEGKSGIGSSGNGGCGCSAPANGRLDSFRLFLIVMFVMSVVRKGIQGHKERR